MGGYRKINVKNTALMGGVFFIQKRAGSSEPARYIKTSVKKKKIEYRKLKSVIDTRNGPSGDNGFNRNPNKPMCYRQLRAFFLQGPNAKSHNLQKSSFAVQGYCKGGFLSSVTLFHDFSSDKLHFLKKQGLIH